MSARSQVQFEPSFLFHEIIFKDLNPKFDFWEELEREAQGSSDGNSFQVKLLHWA